MLVVIRFQLLTCCLVLLALGLPAQAESTVQTPPPVLSGTLSSTGSDTLHNMMLIWRRQFVALHPHLNIQIQSSGSATAPVALLEGTASLGPMSRPMLAIEQERFRRRFGYDAIAVPVALDMLALYVHQDNPLQSITMAQLEGIFAQNRLCHRQHNIQRWGDLELGGSWRNRPISAYGRNPASGTYGFFRQQVLCEGDYQPRVQQMPGAAAVVRAVSQSVNAIGYSGLGQQIAGVKVLALQATAESPALLPTPEHAVSGQYPLARVLYIYLNKAPERALPAAEKAFLRFVLSPEGQALLQNDGLVVVPEVLRQHAIQELGL